MHDSHTTNAHAIQVLFTLVISVFRVLRMRIPGAFLRLGIYIVSLASHAENGSGGAKGAGLWGVGGKERPTAMLCAKLTSAKSKCPQTCFTRRKPRQQASNPKPPTLNPTDTDHIRHRAWVEFEFRLSWPRACVDVLSFCSSQLKAPVAPPVDPKPRRPNEWSNVGFRV